MMSSPAAPLTVIEVTEVRERLPEFPVINVPPSMLNVRAGAANWMEPGAGSEMVSVSLLPD